jgi:cytochrome c oxidase assembly protein subunit 15
LPGTGRPAGPFRKFSLGSFSKIKRSRVLKSVTTPYNRSHHVFATFVACTTFVLIVAGALVTSNDAGLAVPDWPTSFGSFAMPRMVGGVLYEHGHRMIAGATAILTVALALWTWLVDRRGWMKKLAWAAFSTILVQAILGGITVLHFLPPAVSTAHALVGQSFFCIAVVIALFTGKRFLEEEPRTAVDRRRPTLLTLTVLSVAVLCVQLVLGGMFRHKGMGWQPHVLNTITVVVLLTWTAIRTLSHHSQIEALRRPAILMLALMLLQLGLGFLAFVTKVIEGPSAVQPLPTMVWSTVSHVATGALLLATTVVLAIQTYRYLGVPAEEWVQAQAGGAARMTPRTSSARSATPEATA